MKKKYLIVLCLALMALLTVSAAAAGLSATAAADKNQLSRGDTVTVTVSLSQTPSRSGGVTVSYDSAVLELVKGEILLEGTALKDWGKQNPNQGVFVFSAEQTISGAVARCTFKVKADAPFGNTSVKLTVTSGANSGEASASLSVVCTHKYGAWVMTDDNVHSHTCSVCNHMEPQEHSWKVTAEKAATCAAEGSRTHQCTACGHTRTEVLPKTQTHTWNSGEVTKKATCTEEGEKKFTCTTCSATRTEVIAKAKHTYDGRCDTTCNVCGGTREITHKYGEEWTADGVNHWHACVYCGHRKDEAAHTPGPEATEQTAQTCTVCGYILQQALGHTHSYQQEWTSDGSGHWHACSGCDVQSEKADHVYDNSCDTDCNTCGYQRETEHLFYENYMSNEQGHWHECRVCGYSLEMEPHVADSEGKCQACGRKMVADHDHTYSTWKWDSAGHWQECDCGAAADSQDHAWEEGTVIKRPTDTQDGARLHVCGVCGAERVELIHAGTVIADNTLWTVLLIAGGAVILGVGTAVVLAIVKGRKKTGKFTEE